MYRHWSGKLNLSPSLLPIGKHCTVAPRIWLMITFLVVAIFAGLFDAAQAATMPRKASSGMSTVIRCKYSVRDVAFVNIHGKPWQLELIKPPTVDEEQFRLWSQTIRNKLSSTNVGFVWHEHDSEPARQLALELGQVPLGQPSAAITNAGEDIRQFTFGNSDAELATNLDQLINSPVRASILRQIVDSLCVVVLFESGSTSENQSAAERCELAIEQLNNQMWTLEKPTDKGPAFIRVSLDQLKDEPWLSESLGVHQAELPAVAILYGQGRRLGEILSGSELTQEIILGRSSICGRDCECNLNRDWLYGRQLIHVWDEQHERQAAASLEFDPHSAFVMAEVSQIIRKNSTTGNNDQRINLGAGLIIHDLDSTPNSADTDPIASVNPVEPSSSQTESAAQELLSNDSQDDSSHVTSSIPWLLIISLAFLLVIVIVGIQLKATRRP